MLILLTIPIAARSFSFPEFPATKIVNYQTRSAKSSEKNDGIASIAISLNSSHLETSSSFTLDIV